MAIGARADLGDGKLIQIVDAAMSEAVRRCGAWLACRPGCTECCIGAFPITQLDARRLRAGLASLDASHPELAAQVRSRAHEAVSRLKANFPGDPKTGVLAEGAEAEERFEAFANDEPCPALNPETGLCDLYAWRPVTCRTFGPAIRSEDSLAVCELCFQGATGEEIVNCAVELDFEQREEETLRQLEMETGAKGETIVAFALVTQD